MVFLGIDLQHGVETLLDILRYLRILCLILIFDLQQQDVKLTVIASRTTVYADFPSGVCVCVCVFWLIVAVKLQ